MLHPLCVIFKRLFSISLEILSRFQKLSNNPRSLCLQPRREHFVQILCFIFHPADPLVPRRSLLVSQFVGKWSSNPLKLDRCRVARIAIGAFCFFDLTLRFIKNWTWSGAIEIDARNTLFISIFENKKRKRKDEGEEFRFERIANKRDIEELKIQKSKFYLLWYSNCFEMERIMRQLKMSSNFPRVFHYSFWKILLSRRDPCSISFANLLSRF